MAQLDFFLPENFGDSAPLFNKSQFPFFEKTNKYDRIKKKIAAHKICPWGT